jgi:glycosyltransferase involved in cell wall biosynthesis
LGLSKSKRYLLFVGRFEDGVKRISSIITVFGNLATNYPDVHLLIIGGGRDEQSLKNLAMELVPGRIFFPGWIAHDYEKVLYYNVSECLILASLREASPAVIGEAFSCGVPVVTSNVGGVDDLVIPGESGWLFSAGDDNAMQEHLDYVLANPDIITRMRSVVRKIAEEKVSVPAIRSALQKGFSSVLKHRN